MPWHRTNLSIPCVAWVESGEDYIDFYVDSSNLVSERGPDDSDLVPVSERALLRGDINVCVVTKAVAPASHVSKSARQLPHIESYLGGFAT